MVDAVMPPGFEDDDESVEEVKRPYYPNAGAFVHEQILPTFGKNWTVNTHWCREWFEHEEAVRTFTAAWRSWEHVRHEPAKMMGWIQNYLHPTLDRLLSDAGPFVGCEYGRDGRIPYHDARTPTNIPIIRPLPVDPIPEGLFEDVPTEADNED